MSGSARNWLGQSKWGLRASFAILAVIGAILLGSFVFDAHEIETVVTQNDVPLNCNRSTRTLWGHQPAQRDFVPEDERYDYCGLVWTEHGAFKLPHSYAMPLVQDSRKNLVQRLKEGCSYTLKVVGTGGAPSKDPNVSRKLGRIVRVLQEPPCA